MRGRRNSRLSDSSSARHSERTHGSVVGTETVTVPAYSRIQEGIFELIDSVPQSDRRIDDYFVTYTTTGGPIVVYAAVVDNHTGDGYYLTGFCAN